MELLSRVLRDPSLMEDEGTGDGREVDRGARCPLTFRGAAASQFLAVISDCLDDREIGSACQKKVSHGVAGGSKHLMAGRVENGGEGVRHSGIENQLAGKDGVEEFVGGVVGSRISVCLGLFHTD